MKIRCVDKLVNLGSSPMAFMQLCSTLTNSISQKYLASCLLASTSSISLTCGYSQTLYILQRCEHRPLCYLDQSFLSLSIFQVELMSSRMASCLNWRSYSLRWRKDCSLSMKYCCVCFCCRTFILDYYLTQVQSSRINILSYDCVDPIQIILQLNKINTNISHRHSRSIIANFAFNIYLIILSLFINIIQQLKSTIMSSFQFYQSNNNPHHPYHPNIEHHHDLDFYKRKSDRLEQDLLTISEQLNKARLRLRRAEDFQIKFDLLLKQKSLLEDQNIMKGRQACEVRAKYQQLQLCLKDNQQEIQQMRQQSNSLMKDVQSWKNKFLQSEQRLSIIGHEYEERACQSIQRQLHAIKKSYAIAEQELKFQMSRLTKQLDQKVLSEQGAFEKQQKLKSQKQSQIVRLQEVINKSREQYIEMVQSKNREIEVINNKLRATFSQQIHHIKDTTSQQNQRFLAELDQLKQILRLKNQQILHLQQQLRDNLSQSISQRDRLNEEIGLLKDKIYERQRQNELQLSNMKERLIAMHEVDIESMKQRYNKMAEELREELKQVGRVMRQKDEKVAFELGQFERARAQLKQVIGKKDELIQQLKKFNSQSSVSNTKQFNTIYQALNSLTNQKQTHTTEYQSNITFLNQQIIKLTSSNELKNNQIRQLHQYHALLKKQQFQVIKDLETRWKSERKERESQRERERDARQKVEEEFREREKQWRNRERQLERECQKERRQKSKWMLNNQKLAKQLQRVVKQNQQLESRYKNTLSYNQKTIIFTGEQKRQFANELEKQKNQLELKKRLEIEQIKKQYQLQVSRLRNENESLLNEGSRRNSQIERLQQQLHRLSSDYKSIQKLKKQKVMDYDKKMATLNSQILLTQNLYNSFIEAKSRVTKRP